MGQKETGSGLPIRKILLVGNPNVGKSVIFTRLTGVDVIASNYPGTTIDFSRGYTGHGDGRIEIIDVPGTYGLEPTSPAEKVAVDILDGAVADKDGIVINVVDATNLERNINLTLQLLDKDIPVIVVLNLWDEARHTGVNIDTEKLEEMLGVPVVPTVAITGEGIKRLVDRLEEATAGSYRSGSGDTWAEAGRIIGQVQTLEHRHHTLTERIGDLTIHPWTGIPMAALIIMIVFQLIRIIGEGLIRFVMDPLFEYLWRPVMSALSEALGSGGSIHDILIGSLVDGRIDFGESFGILTTGLYVPFAAVLPYIIAFYLVLSLLEDSGYLPRLAVLLDNFMHSIGLHGMSIIPMFLACGCNVPGVLATRILETRRERFIAATLMSISIPCMAQTAMIFGLLGPYGYRAMLPVFVTLFIIWIVAGTLMRYFVKGESPEIFTEIPAYRLPHWPVMLKKVWMRVRWFLREAIPFVLAGVFIVNVLYSLGVIQFLGRVASPVVTRFLGLPVDAVGALVVGFLRKDLAVGMLAPLGLTRDQLIIASVVLTMYFPCVATFAVLLRELGIRDMAKAAVIMITSAFLVGSLLNMIL